jgi:hypothetical protein
LKLFKTLQLATQPKDWSAYDALENGQIKQVTKHLISLNAYDVVLMKV